MLYIVIITIFLLVFILSYAGIASLCKEREGIVKRLQEVRNLEAKQQRAEEAGSFFERIMLPAYSFFSHLFIRLLPSHKAAAIGKRLERAGLLKSYSVERWLFIKMMTIFIASILSGLLTYMLEPDMFKAAVIAFVIMLFSNVLLEFYIGARISKRKKALLKALPYTLDLIVVSVEAGLSFDGAMARVVNNISGELSEEFAKTLKETRMGIRRKDALRNMSDRCNVKEISSFVISLIQADELGVSLGRVLRIEAANLREQRKQAAREKAMKAPVKMLFPLIFFIFPSIFIIILGPVVIKVYEMFMR